MNGEAIFSTRPWKHAEGTTTEGIPIRFTCKKNILYVILLGKPEKDEILIENLGGEDISQVNLLGVEESLSCRTKGDDLIINLSEKIEDSPAIVFKIVLK